MSYNSNYRNNNGVIYPFAVITAVLLLLENLFFLRSIITSFYYLGDYLNETAFLSFVINMLSLAQLALIMALTISVFARASNRALGNIQIATAIITAIDLTFRFIAFHGSMIPYYWFTYAFLLAYQISMAVVIKTRKEVIKYTWFIPGIMAFLSIGYTVFFNSDSFRFAFESIKYSSDIAGLSYFMTGFLEPVITVAFAFCVMAWASHRIQDKKAAKAQPEASANPAAVSSAGSSRKCPNCGNALSPRDQFCSICGANVKVGFCQNCGSPVNPGDTFCEKCGARVQ